MTTISRAALHHLRHVAAHGGYAGKAYRASLMRLAKKGLIKRSVTQPNQWFVTDEGKAVIEKHKEKD